MRWRWKRKSLSTSPRISNGKKSETRSSETLRFGTISLLPHQMPVASPPAMHGEASTAAIPLGDFLRARQNIVVYACDCSQVALDGAREIVIASDLPSARRQFYPFLHDFSANKFPDWFLCTACQKSSPRKSSIFASDAYGIGLVRLNESPLLGVECCIGGIDYITLIFTLSAIPFQKMSFVITECISVLKPGGLLLFRDYGLFDMTMLRFPPEQRVGFREYIRSDGTLSYFFSLDTARELFLSAGFIEGELLMYGVFDPEYCNRLCTLPWVKSCSTPVH